MASAEGSRQLLLAVDRSEHSLYAFTWGLDNFLRPSDHLYVLYAQETHYSTSALAGTTPDVFQQLREQDMESARTLLKEYGQVCTQRGIPHTCELAMGDPRVVICEFIAEKKIETLILGSRGMGAIKRALIGSVSDYCVHNAKCPVVVVKKP
eukprot:comp20640_c0_seq1/m.26724 comp20640_c0_seq1/g.26724  ORF comp20640_c0_seq1/g.26724 comp20640_c0_seq1/m.26724 type:complete len:152 (-) comp20640_c0_seq1:305-760(-)